MYTLLPLPIEMALRLDLDLEDTCHVIYNTFDVISIVANVTGKLLPQNTGTSGYHT
jgi:hypothetical protein